MRTLEAEMLREARTVTGKSKLRQKDIAEWSSAPIKQHDGERLFFLPKLGLHISVIADAATPST